MMDFWVVLKTRRSVREYLDRAISRQEIEKIVDAARQAATARNLQPWEFVAVTKKDTLKKIAELAENGRFIASCAACIAVFSSDTKYYLEDGCAATENMLLAATALGLGSCWVAGDKKPYAAQVLRMLGVPQGFRLVSLVALGYPAQKDALREAEKRQLQTLLHWEKF